MKRSIIICAVSVVLLTTLVLISAFRERNTEPLFYYAFNEKIPLEVVPGKFVIRYANEATGKAALSAALSSKNFSLDTWKDERTAMINAAGKTLDVLKTELDAKAGYESLMPLFETKTEKLAVAATDEILVRFNKNAAQDAVLSTMAQYKLRIVNKGELFYTLSVPRNASALDIANRIQESGVAEFSHPNFYRNIEMHQAPNDTYFNYQWNLNNTGQVINDGHTGTADADIDAVEAWCKTMGSSSITVAVLDEGLTSNHPDLPNARQVRLNGSNFSNLAIPNDPSPVGDGNHGNACSGIIAATRDNNEGIAGIAPNVKIMPVKILNPSASDANIANAISFAKNNGAQILSNSWGYNSSNPNLIPAVVTAIQDAVTNGRGGLGCVVVFSAGNTADHNAGSNGTVNFPGNVNIPGVITVGASDRYDHQANYSPTSVPASANNQIVDIVAPSHRAYPCQITGETFEIWSMDIPSTPGYNSWHNSSFCMNPPAVGEVLPNSGTNFQSYTGRMGGTSAACPEVAAAAALVLSMNSGLTQMQVFNILTSTTDKVGGVVYNASGFSNEMGYGRLNLNKALTVAGADLYMQDQPTDAGIEPNPDNVSPYWNSQDVWVRNANDGGTVHQNPEYGTTNYVYVKVRNRGYSVSGIGNTLNVYWAKASTGLSWTYPWTGATMTCGANTLNIGGAIGSQSIAALASGASTIYVFPWTPPKPADYDPCFGTDASHFCLLARIVTPCAMTFPEGTNLQANVRNNNNIVWRNISIVDLNPNFAFPYRVSVILTGSSFLKLKFTATDIVFNIPKEKGNTGNIFEVADVDIDLGRFTDAWLNAGGKVTGGKIVKDEKGTRIRVAATTVTLSGVPIDPKDRGSITMQINKPITFKEGSVYLFDLKQMDGKNTIGGERFQVNFNAKGKLPPAPATTAAASESFSGKNLKAELKTYQSGSSLVIQMNDNKQYQASVFSSDGKLLFSGKMINQLAVPAGSFAKGVYFVKLNGLNEKTTQSATVMIR